MKNLMLILLSSLGNALPVLLRVFARRPRLMGTNGFLPGIAPNSFRRSFPRLIRLSSASFQSEPRVVLPRTVHVRCASPLSKRITYITHENSRQPEWPPFAARPEASQSKPPRRRIQRRVAI